MLAWACTVLSNIWSSQFLLSINRDLFLRWPFQGGSSVASLIWLCVGGFIWGVCFVIISYPSLLFLVHRENCAAWLWHFLGNVTYVFKCFPWRNWCTFRGAGNFQLILPPFWKAVFSEKERICSSCLLEYTLLKRKKKKKKTKKKNSIRWKKK